MGGTRVYIGGLPYGVREKDLERFFKGYGRIRDILIKNGYGFVEFDDYRDADDAVYELNGKDLLGERILVQLAHASSGSQPPMRSSFSKDRRHSGSGSGSGSRDRDGYRGSGDRRTQVIVERARGVPRDGRGGGMGGGSGGRDGGRMSQVSRTSRGPPRGSGSGSDKYGPPTRTEYRLVVENLSSRVSWQDLKDYMRQAGEVTYADAHKQKRNEGVVEFASYSDLKAAVDKLDDTELNGRRIRLVEDRGRGGGRSGGGRRSKSSSRSRSRSRSRRRDSRSRSKSKSKSRSKSRSKSHSKSRSRSKSVDSKRSKSRSPDKVKKETTSRSPSRSRSRSKSRDKSRSRSVSKTRDSRSRSKSVEKNGDRSSGDRDVKDEDADD